MTAETPSSRSSPPQPSLEKPAERPQPIRSLVSSVSSQTAAMFPAFLVGAMAVEMGAELGFSDSSLGAAVAFFFLLAAVTSAHAGALTDRLGPQRSLRVANLLSGMTMLLIALVVRNYWVLLIVLAVGAFGLTVAGPGTKTMVARGVPARRHGFAFGIQAAAVPFSVFLAGLAVPVIGLSLGWRWAFAGAALVPLLGFAAAPGYRARPQRAIRAQGVSRGLSDIDYRPLNLLGLAAALGSAAGTSMAAFFVSAATGADIGEGPAGFMLAAASGAAIVMRILMGYLADRRESGHLRVVAAMLALSTVGYLAAATGSAVLLPLGAILALGAGWSWSGVMVHAVVLTYRGSPGAATGMTSGGLNVGGVVGPLVFGFLAEHISYGVGFLTLAGCALLGAVAAYAAWRRLDAMEPG